MLLSWINLCMKCISKWKYLRYFSKEKVNDLAAKIKAEKVALKIVERLIEPDVTEKLFLKTVRWFKIFIVILIIRFFEW